MAEATPAEKLTMFIDEAAVHARLSIDEYTRIAKRAADRLSGNRAAEKEKEGSWQDDSLAWWANVARDYAKAFELWQRSIGYTADAANAAATTAPAQGSPGTQTTTTTGTEGGTPPPVEI